jgi:hypothetical protein
MGRFILITVMCALGGIGFSQSLTRARINIEFANEADQDQKFWIGDCVSEMGNSIEYYNKGNAPFQGFSRICDLQGDISFHIEKFDEFTILIPDLSTNGLVTYSGKRGVEKNVYVRDRQQYLRLLEGRSDFLDATPTAFKAKINHKKDSLLSIAKNLKLSNTFIEDEELFWEYYMESFLLFYDSLKSGSSDITKADEKLFKPVSYYSREEQRSFPDYRRMVYAYYWPKVESITSYDELMGIFKEADSEMTEYHIINIAKALVFNRHANSEYYVKLIEKKHTYKTDHIEETYETLSEIRRGQSMVFPPVKSLSGETIQIQNEVKKATYFFIYTTSSSRLVENNFLKWKDFYSSNKGSQDHRFMTIGVDVDSFKDQLPQWLSSMNIPGTHLTVDAKHLEQLKNNFGLSFLPTIVETDSDGAIQNWNVLAELKQLKQTKEFLEEIPWIVKTGMRH